MFTGKEVLVVSLLLVLLESDVHGRALVIPGGCLAKGSNIFFSVPAQNLNKDLVSRIYEITLGNHRSKKEFDNRQGCLPKYSSYLEYRLNPNLPDTNRIVRKKNSKRLSQPWQIFSTSNNIVTRLSPGCHQVVAINFK